MKRTLTITGIALLALPAALAGQTSVRAEAQASVRMESHAQYAERPEQEQDGGAAETEVHARLAAAREALSQNERAPSQEEAAAGADALALGAAHVDLVRIARSAPAERSLVASLETLAELRSRGVASSRAAAAISGKLARGASDRAIALLTTNGALGGSGADVAGRPGMDAATRAAGSISVGAGGLLQGGAGMTGSLTGGVRSGIIP